MTPSSIQDDPKENVVSTSYYKYLTTAAIYGANSSGKSNLVMALAAMKHLVLNSVRLNDHDALTFDPFLLNVDGGAHPTLFELVYLTEDATRLRYGFEYHEKQVMKEWLFVSVGNKKEQPYFVREEDGIAVNEKLFSEGMGLEERTNDNRLFVSLVAQLGGKVSKGVVEFFNSGYDVISGLNTLGYEGLTEQMFLSRTQETAEALKFFRDLQLGFNDIEASESQTPTGQKVVDIYTNHNIYDDAGEVAGTQRFKFSKCESQGTQKLFELAGPLFHALSSGCLLVLDELDAKMHPLISRHIIRLFSRTSTNPHHAQLIFTTHDTNILSSRLLRRDQIWFTEKDETESTDLYSLMNIVLPDGTKPRGDGNLERNYIKGRYGAIPYLRTWE
jgi:energy-coupling factor transporter ATP-binding protein EcfA2